MKIRKSGHLLRRGKDRFLLVTGTAFGTHDRAWLERNMPRDGSVYVSDVTSAYACLCLWGPKAREVVSFDPPYMTSREVTVGNVPCIASNGFRFNGITAYYPRLTKQMP